MSRKKITVNQWCEKTGLDFYIYLRVQRKLRASKMINPTICYNTKYLGKKVRFSWTKRKCGFIEGIVLASFFYYFKDRAHSGNGYYILTKKERY
jgi:hypothetical protein